MQMPDEIEPQDSIPVLPYAPAGRSGGDRWAAFGVLSPLLVANAFGWLVALNFYGIAYGSISQLSIALVFFLAVVGTTTLYTAELVFLCAVAGNWVRAAAARAVIGIAMVPPALWLGYAFAFDHHMDKGAEMLLLLLLLVITLVPVLTLRSRNRV